MTESFELIHPLAVVFWILIIITGAFALDTILLYLLPNNMYKAILKLSMVQLCDKNREGAYKIFLKMRLRYAIISAALILLTAFYAAIFYPKI